MTHLIGPNFSDMSDIDAHVASISPALTPVKLVHTQTSLNSEGNSDNDSNELREDIEITIDQADAWGFGGRGSNATAQVSRLHNEMYILSPGPEIPQVCSSYNAQYFDTLGYQTRALEETDLMLIILSSYYIRIALIFHILFVP